MFDFVCAQIQIDPEDPVVGAAVVASDDDMDQQWDGGVSGEGGGAALGKHTVVSRRVIDPDYMTYPSSWAPFLICLYLTCYL